MNEEYEAALAALRALDLEDQVSVAARALAEQVLPALLELDDVELRGVLCAALARRRPYLYSPHSESRLFLAVPGPAARHGRPDWRHRTVAPARSRRPVGEAPKKVRKPRGGPLGFAGDCPACGTELCGDALGTGCPICGESDLKLRRP